MITKSPREVARQITADSNIVTDEKVKQDMLEAAETIEYLLKLIEVSAEYIQHNSEYGKDPLFLRAVMEALGKS